MKRDKNRPMLFLDDGGVMNDNSRRSVQWQQLVETYFGSRFGGSDWTRANEKALVIEMDMFRDFLTKNGGKEFNAFQKEMDYIWLKTMFDHVRISVPPKEEAIRITREAIRWITPRVRSSINGVKETIPLLSQMMVIHTASNEDSEMLRGYLSGMRLLSYFDRLYGPDLIDFAKGSWSYYDKIFELEKPELAIVVDDKEECLDFAEEAGTIVVHSVITGGKPAKKYWISEFSSLPQVISKILKAFGGS